MPKLVRKQQAPSVTEIPDTLKPYIQHGLDLNYKNGAKEAGGECPFCYKEKFSVNVDKGVWQCFTCSKGGSIYQFLEELLDVSDQATKPSDYVVFAKERGLEFPETLMTWKLCKSVLTGEWLVPAWGPDYNGKLRLQQLYMYVKSGGRRILLPTKNLKHGLYGLHQYDKAKPFVYLCEGPWDGMRMWETLKTVKLENQEILQTASLTDCALAEVNVLAAPSCSSFSSGWTKWFKSKGVLILYDSDYPTPTPNGERAPAGTEGVKRAVRILAELKDKIELSYVDWGPDGYDPNLPNGYDVRDALKESKTEGLRTLLARAKEVPDTWRVSSTVSVGGELICRPCNDWKVLINSWRKALKWTDGLDHALAVMLATVASTGSIGDQLWVKIIGPPSSGKSTLCEAISVNKRFILAKSTIRGFHSGYKTDAAGTQDNSLIPMVMGKTLVTKDGDTLLQSPNLGQILSEARDIFDCVSRTHYRNKMGKDYEGIRMTWLLCGTSGLRQIDASELGQRFLDCVIMEGIDLELEDDILWRMANKAAAHVDIEADGTSASQHSAEAAEAMELTGGYVEFLRTKASELFPKISFAEEEKRKCVDIARFVAYMRARPSRSQSEIAERELAARLVAQHIRLAKCLALVLNRIKVDDVVLSRVRRVGLDTARGVVLDICLALYNKGLGGLSVPAITLHVNFSDKEKELRALLGFLRRIGVVERLDLGSRKNNWRLTNHLTNLFNRVIGKGA